MSLADGLAAVIGTRYGNRQKYLVLGYTKSVLGTLTFFVVSLGILFGYSHYSHSAFGIEWNVFVAVAASVV
jgi:dolichol kinase